jgi:hypothetical protein
MSSVREDARALREQLHRGSIQRGYRAVLVGMTQLRAHFKKTCPSYGVTGLYQGLLDMSYFALVPPSFKRRGLKIAVVFNYEAFRFEAWLAAANRQIQQTYCDRFRDSHWAGYRVSVPAAGVDSIVECVIADDPDFGDLDSLMARIGAKVAGFIADMESALAGPAPAPK